MDDFVGRIVLQLVFLNYLKDGRGQFYRVGFVSGVDSCRVTLSSHYEPLKFLNAPMPNDYKTT